MSHPSLSDSFENENQFHLGIIILEKYDTFDALSNLQTP